MKPSFDMHALFVENYAYVKRTLARLGVASGEVEDACQEVFLHVHTRRDSFERGRPVRPWLFGFAVRVAANQRRREWRHDHSIAEENEPVDAASLSPEAHVERAQKRALLLRGLDVLDLDQRAVLVAHDLDGIEASDLATLLGIPVNTVYSRLRLARRAVTAEVSRLEEGA